MALESVFKLSLIMSMVDNLTTPMVRLQKHTNESTEKLRNLESNLGTIAKTGAALATAGEQLTQAALEPVKATFETQKALGELSSLGIKDLGALEQAATDFSDTWAGTSKADFITAAYDIKSGISSLSDTGVASFTEIAGITAKGTKSTIAEMTNLFATGYGIYKNFYSDLSDEAFGEMFSAGIAKSVQQFKTTGSGMAQAIQTLGASATTAQIPLEEQLSILGMLQATMSGSEAGTKYKAFLRSAMKGGKELGLSFVDANNQMLSMPEILDKLRGKFGETMDAAEKLQLQQAFGDTEAVALIDLLYSKTGELENNIVSMYGTLGDGISVATGMAEAINKTTPDQYEVLQQKIHNVKETLGNSLLPTVNEYLDKGAAIVSNVGDWVSNHQALAGTILKVVAVSGGLMTVIGILLMIGSTFGLMATKISSGFKIVKAVFSGVGTLIKGLMSFVPIIKSGLIMTKAALTPLISSVWSFTAALLANPITWIVIGVMALIAILILLWNKCEWFRNGVMAGLNWIKNGAAAVFNGLKAIFSSVANVIGHVTGAISQTVSQKLGNMKRAYEEHGGGIKGAAAAAWEGIKGFYTAGFSFIDNLTGGKLTEIKNKLIEGAQNAIQGLKDKISGAFTWLKDSGKKVLTTFTDGIKETVSAPIEAVKGALQKIRNMLPFSDAKTGPLSRLTLSGSRTLTTMADGMKRQTDAPADEMNKSLSKVDLAQRKAVKKINLSSLFRVEAEKTEKTGTQKERVLHVEHLHITVNPEDIESMKKIKALLSELEDVENGTDEPEVVTI